MDGYPGELRISPADWPDGGGAGRPGDLQRFVPQGFGLGAPHIVTPYGGPSGGFYGFDQLGGHPVLNAPTSEAMGGTLYFDDDIAMATLVDTLRAMGVGGFKTYAAFASSSEDPNSDRYLDQLRLVSNAALAALFGAEVSEALLEQSLDISEAILGFVGAQKDKWNDKYLYSEKLAGLAGGDGDWAKESLAFGFHVENTYWGVYRVWSRAWLVTK